MNPTLSRIKAKKTENKRMANAGSCSRSSQIIAAKSNTVLLFTRIFSGGKLRLNRATCKRHTSSP